MADLTISANLKLGTAAITTVESEFINNLRTASSSTATVEGASEVNMAGADIFTQHFRDLQEAIPNVRAVVQSATSLDLALPVSDDLVLHILRRENSRVNPTKDNMHAAAMAGISVLTDEEKLHLILKLDLSIRFMQREAAAIKENLVSKDQALEAAMAELSRDKEGLERARDMFVNERELLTNGRTVLAHDQAALDQDIDRYGRFLNLGQTIQALEHAQQVESELVVKMQHLIAQQHVVDIRHAATITGIVSGPSGMMSMVQETNFLMKQLGKDTTALAQSTEHLKLAHQANQLQMEEIKEIIKAATQAPVVAEVKTSLCIIL